MATDPTTAPITGPDAHVAEPDALAAQTLPLLAAVVCGHRAHDVTRVAETLNGLDLPHLQALVVGLAAMVPTSVPLPAPAGLATLIANLQLNADISPQRAARNRAVLADATGMHPEPDDQTAVCSRCEKRLPHSRFHHDKSTSSGLSYRCKDCDSRMRAAHRRHGTTRGWVAA
ncbi:hypothetical protein [Actinomadura rudentiformis]|uniref:Uncharacterized protein n=1 Tax=Actinomadura rudentiformis TaxID=359158 RepID=A0A6H9YXD6_9ACTN|nr:hypothetical protein [Actinomadura rudentiformis]KAB2344832.1 hypothetical protein F8566_30030 [Actinomadura rudentiformis]